MELKRYMLNEDLSGLAARLRGQPGDDEVLRADVEQIISRVRQGGDEALVEYTRRFDCAGFTMEKLRVPASEIEAAAAMAPETLTESLKLAAENIRLFHQHEMRGGWTAAMRQSQMLGQRIIPVDRAGLYVPGGGASYPSTVLMTAIPAQVAGVKEIFICTPPRPDCSVNQAVLAAAGMLDITEVYRAGGAQAIAAMTFGTEMIRAADVISGPGNIYVTEAKRQVYGRVGLDGLAGPSEVLIIADEFADPELIAVDMLAQVEHGSGAIAVLVCWSGQLVEEVEAKVQDLAADLQMDAALLENISVVVIQDETAEVDSLDRAIAFSNIFAPEHLQVHTRQPEQVVHEITCAGAVFLGEDVCTTYGDYIVGSNHVLPTSGTARFGSALSVENYLRKVAVISLIPDTISELTGPLVEIAVTEGLRAHARAARMRFEKFAARPEEE
ncbi:MAG: histidinol dehydrogenase [Thermoleophilia bacterium]|nr:histidinol dehydrogenase [Thermoleophilia bacterium]